MVAAMRLLEQHFSAWPGGYNAADLMFSQAVSGIRSALDSLPEVRAAIPDRNKAETIVRLIAENGLQISGAAFQRYAEFLYTRYSSLTLPRRNAFQNLRDGSDLWFAASGKTLWRLSRHRRDDFPYALFPTTSSSRSHTGPDRCRLHHAHRPSYRVAQRLVIREGAVREGLLLIEKLTTSMAADTPPR